MCMCVCVCERERERDIILRVLTQWGATLVYKRGERERERSRVRVRERVLCGVRGDTGDRGEHTSLSTVRMCADVWLWGGVRTLITLRGLPTALWRVCGARPAAPGSAQRGTHSWQKYGFLLCE